MRKGRIFVQLMAVPIRDFDFTSYGTYYRMPDACEGVSHTLAAAYEDHMTRSPLIDTPAHLGLTFGAAAPCAVTSMEKHSHTQEAILCMAEPVILCVAASDGGAPPRAYDLRAVILYPGDVAVMDREVWHDACRGLGRRAGYYYLATAGKQPAVWVDIQDGPVTLSY